MKLNPNHLYQILTRSILVLVLFLLTNFIAFAQMPPPGYERAKKIQEEQMKIPRLDRDSITVIDTTLVFDPQTYEEEIIIVQSRMSVRDYCYRYLGMGNADILLDGNPHTIIDPRTYNEMTIRLTPAGKIETIPK